MERVYQLEVRGSPRPPPLEVRPEGARAPRSAQAPRRARRRLRACKRLASVRNCRVPPQPHRLGSALAPAAGSAGRARGVVQNTPVVDSIASPHPHPLAPWQVGALAGWPGSTTPPRHTPFLKGVVAWSSATTPPRALAWSRAWWRGGKGDAAPGAGPGALGHASAWYSAAAFAEIGSGKASPRHSAQAPASWALAHHAPEGSWSTRSV